MRAHHAMFALLLYLVLPTAHALDYTKYNLHALPRLADSVIGDVNGDGLDDIVALHQSDPGKIPYDGRIAIYLQRPSRNFDFPIVHECGCAPEQLRLVRDPRDPRLRILFASFLDPWIGPGLTKGGFELLEVKPDGTVAAKRYNDMELFNEAFSLADVNQDGREDLFYTYQVDDNTTVTLESTYKIWYGFDRIERSASRDATAVSGYRAYQGPEFLFLDPYRVPVADRVDINADGFMDVIEGLCPTACLFEQQPYGKLEAAPIVFPEATGASTFGDLDGDGLPDMVLSPYSGNDLVRIYLQTSFRNFELAGEIGPYSFVGPSTVADFDNNGLNDLAFVEEDLCCTTPRFWLNTWLQTAPGELQLVRKFMATGAALEADDIDQDGCRDLLTPSLLYLRGRGCGPAADLEVRASVSGATATVAVSHRAGTRSYAAPVVRVVLAPTVKTFALTVTPPAGCVQVAGETARHVFDCPLSQLLPGQQKAWSFQVGVASGNTTAILLNAFLLDGAGDINPDNNRARQRSTFAPMTRR